MLSLALKRSLNQAFSARHFHAGASILAAKIFDMPAMSPTMEAGAIVEWKVKPGEKYNSGDPLLDIETDKATISVDAIDDGVLAKILLPDGTKDIKVGTPIAYIAEDGEDLATLEYPPLPTESAAAPAAASAPATEPTPTPAPAAEPKSTPAPSSASASTRFANPNQVLFPSVELLLYENNISKDEAFSKIPATGPHGRLLKGDVLAYLGKISPSENTILAEYLEKKSHLDLSNIELRESVPKKEKESKTSKPKVKEPVTVNESYPLDIEVGYPQLQSFKKAIAKAISLTEKEVYAYNLNPVSDLDDPLFDDIIAPLRNAERFTISYKLNSDETEISSLDVTLTLNEKCYDANERATLFISKFKNNLTENLKDF